MNLLNLKQRNKPLFKLRIGLCCILVLCFSLILLQTNFVKNKEIKKNIALPVNSIRGGLSQLEADTKSMDKNSAAGSSLSKSADIVIQEKILDLLDQAKFS